LPEYRSYIELLEIVRGIQYEARIAALNALWRMSLSIMNINIFKESYIELLVSYHNTSLIHLRKFCILQSALKIIDNAMGCNSLDFIEYESERLVDTLELYNDLAELMENAIIEFAKKRGEEPPEHLFNPPLDMASLQPSPDIIVKMKSCLNNPQNKSIWDIVDISRECILE
jgi:hypothetical protein